MEKWTAIGPKGTEGHKPAGIVSLSRSALLKPRQGAQPPTLPGFPFSFYFLAVHPPISQNPPFPYFLFWSDRGPFLAYRSPIPSWEEVTRQDGLQGVR